MCPSTGSGCRNDKRDTMKRRGSALVIAMMLIASIGAVAFGMGRLIFAQTAIATTYENGAVAYYSAESGIEEAFLRYRYDKNAEIPYANPPREYWTLEPVVGTGFVFRSDLTNNKVYGLSTSTPPVADNVGVDPATSLINNTQIYDLRMGFIGTEGNQYYGGDFSDLQGPGFATGDQSYLKIAKDNAIKIDLSKYDIINNDFELDAKFFDLDSAAVGGNGNSEVNGNERCKAVLEVKLTIDDASGIKEYKELLIPSDPTGTCATVLGIRKEKLYSNSNRAEPCINPNYCLQYQKIKTNFFTRAGRAPTGITTLVNADLTVKPLFSSAAIAITPTDNDGNFLNTFSNHSNIISGPFTYITSTGYFGNTSRKMEANIDRQNGTLYDLYDYVLFKGN